MLKAGEALVRVNPLTFVLHEYFSYASELKLSLFYNRCPVIVKSTFIMVKLFKIFTAVVKLANLQHLPNRNLNDNVTVL